MKRSNQNFINEKDYCEQLGLLIHEARKNKHYSQHALAKKVGISNQLLSNYERGLSMPNPYLLNELCKCLEIPYDSLYELLSVTPSKLTHEQIKLIYELLNLNLDDTMCQALTLFSRSLIKNYNKLKQSILKE